MLDAVAARFFAAWSMVKNEDKGASTVEWIVITAGIFVIAGLVVAGMNGRITGLMNTLGFGGGGAGGGGGAQP